MGNAIRTDWNNLDNITHHKINKGMPYVEGPTGPKINADGTVLPGGQPQIMVLDSSAGVGLTRVGPVAPEAVTPIIKGVKDGVPVSTYIPPKIDAPIPPASMPLPSAGNNAGRAANDLANQGSRSVSAGTSVVENRAHDALNQYNSSAKVAATELKATEITNAREGLKPIEQIAVGDWVLSQPEAKGAQAYRPVVRAVDFADKSVLTLTIRTSAGKHEAIQCTGNHPFWIKDSDWLSAEQLRPGDVLELADGNDATLIETAPSEQLRHVYNFEVDGFHTYYVGDAGVWVHNTNCAMDVPGADGAGRVTNNTVTLNAGRNTVTATLGADGAPLSASGNLREYFSGLDRSSAEVQAQANAAARGMAGDQGGHLVGHRFVGDQGSANLFPQEGNFNMSAFKTLENDYARYIDKGYEVRFNHSLGDFSSSGRPGSLSVDYGVYDAGGNMVDSWSGSFLNQPGQNYFRRVR